MALGGISRIPVSARLKVMQKGDAADCQFGTRCSCAERRDWALNRQLVERRFLEAAARVAPLLL
jgi:hypothetical protein